MNDMQKYDLNLILNEVRRSIEVGNSDSDHCYRIGCMISCLKFLEEYFKQFIENGEPADICEIYNALDEKQKQQQQKQEAADPWGVLAALDEATKIR